MHATVFGIGALLALLTVAINCSGCVTHLPSSTAAGFLLLPSSRGRPMRESARFAGDGQAIANFSRWPSRPLSSWVATAAPSPRARPFQSHPQLRISPIWQTARPASGAGVRKRGVPTPTTELSSSLPCWGGPVVPPPPPTARITLTLSAPPTEPCFIGATRKSARGI